MTGDVQDTFFLFYYFLHIVNAFFSGPLMPGPFNTPRLGTTTETKIEVTVDAANGEVGFVATEDITVTEPDRGTNQVRTINFEH